MDCMASPSNTAHHCRLQEGIASATFLEEQGIGVGCAKIQRFGYSITALHSGKQCNQRQVSNSILMDFK